MPTVIVSSSSIAAKKERARVLMPVLARMAMGVSSSVNMMRNRLMPSTPMRYSTLMPESQGITSTNW